MTSTRCSTEPGFLVPEREGLLLSACSWASSKWSHLAGDPVILRASAGRITDERPSTMDDDDARAPSPRRPQAHHGRERRRRSKSGSAGGHARCRSSRRDTSTESIRWQNEVEERFPGRGAGRRRHRWARHPGVHPPGHRGRRAAAGREPRLTARSTRAVDRTRSVILHAPDVTNSCRLPCSRAICLLRCHCAVAAQLQRFRNNALRTTPPPPGCRPPHVGGRSSHAHGDRNGLRDRPAARECRRDHRQEGTSRAGGRQARLARVTRDGAERAGREGQVGPGPRPRPTSPTPRSAARTPKPSSGSAKRSCASSPSTRTSAAPTPRASTPSCRARSTTPPRSRATSTSRPVAART